MQPILNAEVVARYHKSTLSALTLLTPLAKIARLFADQPNQPCNLSQNLYDANQFYILPKVDKKKSHILLMGKVQDKHTEHDHNEHRVKNYKPGPFALFYQLNEGTLDKQAKAWYYKQHKEIVGPVSSYNMDKMLYYKKIDEETRVAYQTVDKFVKVGKIRKAVEEETKKSQ